MGTRSLSSIFVSTHRYHIHHGRAACSEVQTCPCWRRRYWKDDLCQASFDWRIREEVHRNSWCRSTSLDFLHELRPDYFQLLGYCWPREVWWPAGWLLHSGAVCYYHVRRYVEGNIQKCSQLAQRSHPCM